MTSQTSANRYTQELENMERLFVRLTQDLEQEMLISDDMTYKPILQTLNNADTSRYTPEKQSN
ncbi:hypothetical protein [Aliamphritea ceti]|uniref:hypothetical protein n=1 Tax=Aliamphritea ceti TaxID=1524258 RepID=UPI0021C25677|nr:hypothetical protein [Aliamphritea ceti]